MPFLKPFPNYSLTFQAACLLGVAFTVSHLIAVFALIWLGNIGAKDLRPDVVVERISVLLPIFARQDTDEGRNGVVETAIALGMPVAGWRRLERLPPTNNRPASQLNAINFATSLKGIGYRVEAVKDRDNPSDSFLAIRVNETYAVLITDKDPFVALVLNLFSTVLFSLVLALVTFVFMSLWLGRTVSEPLKAFRVFVDRFGAEKTGQSLVSPDDVKAPSEVSNVGLALRQMRKRVLELMDQRTRMLTIISHDLRTPLTRLKLRSESLQNKTVGVGIMKDILAIEGTINMALDHLRDFAQDEPKETLDLPSLLQTICADFVDAGYDILYDGPVRFPYEGQFSSLNRAMTNLVENGLKYGTKVRVYLKSAHPVPEQVRIIIADDGPGIPDAEKSKVIQAFQRGENTGDKAGYGLGLSIAEDVVRAHGGILTLADNTPHGLLVLVDLSM